MKAKILTALAIATLLASCQKSQSENIGSDTTRTEVVFTSGITTRATDAQWESDDVIGISMSTADDWESDDLDIYSNTKYTISVGADSSSATITSETPLYYPRSGVADFCAYYPYSENLNGSYPSEYITINTADQSTAEKVKALDYMIAYAYSDDISTKDVIDLNFTHKMSKIVFNVNIAGKALSSTLSNFFFTNVQTSGYMYVAAASLLVDNLSDNITLNYEDDTIEMLILPQLLNSSELYFLKDDVYMSVALNGIFEPGVQYNYTLNVGDDAVTLGDVTISDWGEVVDDSIYTTEDMQSYTLSEVGSYNIPDGNVWVITDSGNLPFESNVFNALKAVSDGRKITLIMPNITTISSYAFENCMNLYSIILPKIETVVSNAFYSCSDLRSVELAEATIIESNAFHNCSGLSSVDLPEVTTIGANAFLNCSALSSISLPNATSIDIYAFCNCTAISSIDVPKLTTISEGLFYGCSTITDISLQNVITIETNAFRYCTALSYVDLPKTISIAKQAFYNCYNLTTLKLTAESEITYNNIFSFDYDLSQASLYLHSDYKSENATLASLGWQSVIYVDSDGNQVD